MRPEVADRRAMPRRVWLPQLAVVLALVLAAIGYVQWRQYQLLDQSLRFQNDGLDWSFSQLETELLRLRNEMVSHLDDPVRHDLDSVRMRYDIFVSRVGLVDHERAARIMADQPGYAPAMAQVHRFVAEADRWMADNPASPLSTQDVKRLIPQADALSVPLHGLSLRASHLLYQRATERTAAVRQQASLSIALTVFLSLLLIALAFTVLRQLRSLIARRLSLERLAASLTSARVEADAANRAKSAFLANMSHEIRTPFHGMLGMMSLLQDSPLTPRQASLVDTARVSAHHLLTILNDVLDIAQLGAGKLQVLPATIDLPDLIAQVQATFTGQAQARGLTLEVKVAPDVPRWVHADAARLRQILANVLSNGLKFTPTGTLKLDVSCRANGIVRFDVTDSGIGMDEATLAQLFQGFTQADASPARHAQGTGLGLQIARDLARLMCGDIEVRSQPRAGSTFSLSLPLPPVAAPVAADTATMAPRPAAARSLRVLVAEDHPVNRAYIEAVLDKLGHRSVFTHDGAQAVQAVRERAESECFDVVLMDLHMPGMDGFSAARAIRAMPPPRGSVPIVALTADAFHESRHLAFESGMNGFLTKPAHLPQLSDALDRYSGITTSPAPAPAEGATQPPVPADPFDGGGLDIATIEDVKQAMTPAHYGALLGRFFDDQARTLSELRIAAATDARTELRDHAHSLKGAAASLGLRGVAVLAAQLQLSPAGTSGATIIARIDALEQQLLLAREHCVRRGLLTA